MFLHVKVNTTKVDKYTIQQNLNKIYMTIYKCDILYSFYMVNITIQENYPLSYKMLGSKYSCKYW